MKIHPDRHDRTTEMDEEGVGWIYMFADEYVEFYDKFEWSHFNTWYAFDMRPPLMDGQVPERRGDRSELPGFWRIKK